ncbi:hypothetical protein [Clostridium sardiniense]|uniref:hypothetical protein n=1 Tax=Clostridium sardiniense TaxID=29369 RepID=UPI00195B5CDB|nr:hypothetical protein [Clostridium sardiniense]MBM7835994.1 flagellar basal body-associated protein FliL [Clostridium sardiniense]
MKKRITFIVIGILLIIFSNTIFTIFYSRGAYPEVFEITKTSGYAYWISFITFRITISI